MTSAPAAVRPTRTGRPSKFTVERQEQILEAIRGGNYLETAARAAGVGKSTFYEWLERFPDFADAVESARAEAEARNVAIIEKAAQASWQAAAWWLERSFPYRWGRRDPSTASAHKVDTPARDPAKDVYRKPTRERLLELIALAREFEVPEHPSSTERAVMNTQPAGQNGGRTPHDSTVR
jgi:transposase